MAQQTHANHVLFDNWLKQNYTLDEVKNILEKEGYIEEQIIELVGLYKKRKLNERTNRGFILMGIGCFLGFISCLFTVLGFFPEIKDFILYGLTSGGIIIALIGGYYVFE